MSSVLLMDRLTFGCTRWTAATTFDVCCTLPQASRFWAAGSDSEDEDEVATSEEEEASDNSSSSESGDEAQKKGPSK